MWSASMTRFSVTACLAVALVFGGAVAEAGVMAQGSTVAGKTIGEWTAEWWRWAFAQSKPNDAFTDLTGANANVGQSGPVFFVAGTAGTVIPGHAPRSFTVPSDKYLLIPLVNYEDSQLEQTLFSNPGVTALEVQQGVKGIANQFDILFAEIDGVAVPDLWSHREASPEFSWVGDNNNPFNLQCNPSGNPSTPCVSGFAYADGYWLMLEPLGQKTTTIRFGGGITNVFGVDVTDTVTGVPEPGTLALLAIGLLPGAAFFLRKKYSAG